MSNNKRRPLNAAMDVAPDKLAFIRGGVPEPVAPVQAVAAVEHAKPEISAVESETLVDSEPIELERVVEQASTERRRSRRGSRSTVQSREEPMLGMANLLVPLTTRLSPSTAAALKRAGLEQKLYGREPGTVQEIAEDAIRSWLATEGYL
jgi:hypothetical protein